MTFISRVLGLFRDMLLLSLFGASASYDAFLVAFKIPNFMRRLSAEGAFSQAFVPVLAEEIAKGQEQTRQFINNMAGVWALVLLVLSLVGIVGAPYIIHIFAPGFAKTDSRYTLSVLMLRITFPYVLFISMTSFFSGILNAHHKFAIPAIGPVFLNICLIIAAAVFSPYFPYPVVALAWGVVISGLMQMLFQMPFLVQLKLLPKIAFHFNHPAVKRVLKCMVPALFGVSVVQVNLMLDTLFSSFLPTGSVTWLYTADRLMQFPLGVFGVALATVSLPKLADYIAQDNPEKFEKTLDKAILLILYIGLPAAVGLGTLAGPMLMTLFQYGSFSVYDVYKTLPCVQLFALGLLPFILIKVLANAFYARKEIKIPAYFALVALIVNLLCNMIFIRLFFHVGLVLSTLISACINAFLLLWLLNKRQIYRFPFQFLGQFSQYAFAAFAMGALLKITAGPIDWWAHAPFWLRIGGLGILIGFGALVYFGLLTMLKRVSFIRQIT